MNVNDLINDNPRPDDYIIKDLKWKHLLRSIERSKNVMFVGHSGCGKTEGAYKAADSLGRDIVPFNIGSMQDPRTSLIGTREVKNGETYFKPSKFAKTIQRTDGPVVLLDELTRGGLEAWNILITVLDERQRYLSLDESLENSVIEVDPSVSFIATANIGVSYTATRTMDQAIQDRFTFIETDLLDAEEEAELLSKKYPMVSDMSISVISKIAENIRNAAMNENSIIGRIVSTRHTLEMASMIADGFELEEVAELVIFPLYDNVGGEQSERAQVRKIVERFSSDSEESPDEVEEIFDEEFINEMFGNNS